MPTITIAPGTRITKEVREAIDKKLTELEGKSEKEGTNLKINDHSAAWSVNYTT